MTSAPWSQVAVTSTSSFVLVEVHCRVAHAVFHGGLATGRQVPRHGALARAGAHRVRQRHVVVKEDAELDDREDQRSRTMGATIANSAIVWPL